MEMKLDAGESLASMVLFVGDMTIEGLNVLCWLVDCHDGSVTIPGNFDVFFLVSVNFLEFIVVSIDRWPPFSFKVNRRLIGVSALVV